MSTKIILILRCVLGVFWIWGGIGKWIHGFEAGPFFDAALNNPGVLSAPYASALTPLLTFFADQGVVIIDVLIPILEIALGAWLLSGKKLTAAAVAQALLRLLFIVCGAISWNPLLVTASLLVIILTIQPRGKNASIV